MDPARRLINLQVLRFAAAALVVHAHAVDLSQHLGATPPVLARGWLENFGAAGVDVFFVISGLIITRTAGRARSATRFAWSRFWRVAPLYWLATLPWIAIKAGALTVPALVASFAFWPAAGHEVVAPVLGVGWTLCFEMLFYAVVALILASGRRRSAILLALTAYTAGWLLRERTGAPAFQFLGNPIILEFLMGAAAAVLAPRVGRRTGAALLALGLLGFAAGLVFGFGQISELGGVITGALSAPRALIWGVPAMLVVLGAVALEPKGEPGPIREGLARLGDASYALYLIHPLALLAAGAVLAGVKGLSGDIVILAALVACPLLGLAVHRWIERPLLAPRPQPRQRPIAPDGPHSTPDLADVSRALLNGAAETR
jgi:exopolysaccharide production protein ExoZ